MVTSKNNQMYHGMQPIRLVTLSFLENKSIEEVREYFREAYIDFNEDYISLICTGCGNWRCTPDTHTSEAEVVSKCSECFKE